VASSPLWANLAAVDVAHVANFALVADDVAFLRAHAHEFAHWQPLWPFAISKDESLQLLKGASTRLEALVQSNPSDVDLALLLLVVYQYRYNLDDNAVHSTFQTFVAATEARFADDYRPVWIAALFLANSGRAVDAVAQFQRILDDPRALATVHPELLLDYAQACYLGAMVRTAHIAAHAYLERTGLTAKEVPLVGAIDERLTTPDLAAEYKPEEVWRLTQGPDTVTFSSTLLSTRFTVPGNWKVRVMGYKNGQSVCLLTPPPIKSKLGKSITLNVVLLQTIHAQVFPDFVSAFTKNLGPGYTFAPSPLALPASAQKAAFRVTNPNLYPDRAGMAGYSLFFDNDSSPTAGLNLDVPSILPKSDSGQARFQVSRQLDRFGVAVHTVVLVDSCVEIADETDALVTTFLSSLRVN